MRRFIWILIILIVSVWIGIKVAEDPGFLFLTYRKWSIEMPLWFAILSLIALLLAGYAVLRFFDGIENSLYRWKNWLRWRRKNKSYSRTNRGLMELIEGQWKSAEYNLLEGIQQSDEPLINYLAAAKAAHEQGAYDRRDTYLRKAHLFAPRAEVAIGLTQAQLQFKQGQLEQALATLGHLRNIAPKQPVVLKLLERLYIHLADWANLLKLLPLLRKAKITNAEYLEKLELKTYQELLKSTANKAEDKQALQTIWADIPRKLQKNPTLVYVYAQQLLTYPNEDLEVEALINKTIKKTWDKDLVRLYGLLQPGNPKKQLSHAEHWLHYYSNQAVLFLTLGRLCMRCQLWGKARDYFAAGLNIEPSRELFAEYGKLLEQLGETSAAMQNYREAANTFQ